MRNETKFIRRAHSKDLEQKALEESTEKSFGIVLVRLTCEVVLRYGPGAPRVLCDMQRFLKRSISLTQKEALVCSTGKFQRAIFVDSESTHR